MMSLPQLDSREIKDLVEEFKEMVPFYTPEWRFSPEDPDAGTTLFLVFANMFYGNIKRFNRVPEKNFVDFINMLDVKLFSKTPAKTFITFELSEGMKEPIYVKKGTSVYGKDEKSEEPISFETSASMLVTPSVMMSAYNVSGKQDKICRVFKRDEEEKCNISRDISVYNFEKFENLQGHVLYISHKDVLQVKSHTKIEIELSTSIKKFKENEMIGFLCDSKYFEWTYFSGEKWNAFESVQGAKNKILLKKHNEESLCETEVNGILGRWIQCRFKSKEEEILKIAKAIELDTIKIQSKYDCEKDAGKRGIFPELIFTNDIVRENSGFYPFGDFFISQNTFYISNEEVLSKKGAKVKMEFQLKFIENKMVPEEENKTEWKFVMKKSAIVEKKIVKKNISQIIWEYWDGTMWTKLVHNKDYEKLFNFGEDGARTIEFICPQGMSAIEVNAQYRYWIRGRVVEIENLYIFDAIYNSPFIEGISLQYDYEEKNMAVENCITYNNAEYLLPIHDFKKEKEVICPFMGLDTKYPALYMGFQIPPLKGPISILFSMEYKKYGMKEEPVLEWEYLSKTPNGLKWNSLKTADKTAGFTENGNVLFVGPQDFALQSIFAQELYWIRILNVDNKYENEIDTYPTPRIKEMHMNTVAAIQVETLLEQVVQKSNKGKEEEYVLSKIPVMEEEIWIDETANLTKEEVLQLEKGEASAIRVIRDSEEEISRVWVKWRKTEDFTRVLGKDRVYTIDATMGILKFGDGIQGMKQPSTGIDSIKANYKTGGGTRGNLPSYSITSFKSPIAFIAKAYNPVGADGGSEGETVEEALQRGANIVTHRNRAVTAEDFESLAKEASRNVARVKCLSNYNGEGKKEIGAVTLVVVQRYKYKSEAMLYFPELKHTVEQYILERCPAVVSLSDRFSIIQPIYLEVCVSALLVVKKIEELFPVEKEALLRLDKFLDTFEGNHDGNGWKIGKYVHQSQFFQLLKSMDAVLFIEKIAVSVYKIENGVKEEIRVEDAVEMPYGLITGGTHQIIVKTL